jgi:hypothetical protein
MLTAPVPPPKLSTAREEEIHSLPVTSNLAYTAKLGNHNRGRDRIRWKRERSVSAEVICSLDFDI